VTAYATPTLASLQRRGSSSRLSGASSPASSQASYDSLRDPEEVEEEREVTHERERNWNSPQPKWNTARHHSHGSNGNQVTSASVHLSQSNSGRSLRASSSLPRLTPEAQRKGSPMVVKSHSHKGKVDSVLDAPASIHPPQGAVPPSPSSKGEASPHTTPLKPAAASRFGWGFSRSHQLPPFDMESSPKRGGRNNKEPDSSHHHTPPISSPSPTPGSRPSSRASGVNRSSLIPVPSTSKRNGLFNSGSFASSTPKANDEEKSHRKRSMEFTESVGSIHPHTIMNGTFGDEDMVLGKIRISLSLSFSFLSENMQRVMRNLCRSLLRDRLLQTDDFPILSPRILPARQRQRFWCHHHPRHQDNAHLFKHLVFLPTMKHVFTELLPQLQQPRSDLLLRTLH